MTAKHRKLIETGEWNLGKGKRKRIYTTESLQSHDQVISSRSMVFWKRWNLKDKRERKYSIHVWRGSFRPRGQPVRKGILS